MFRNNFYSTSRRYQQSPARRHPTEPAQIAVQEEFAESISSQEVQPEFLLQSSQENFSGTVPSDPPVLVPISRLSSQENFSGAAPTGPSVSVPIAQLNSDPQAHLIIRMSKKQQQKPRTVQTPSQFNLHHQAGRNLLQAVCLHPCLQKLLQESIYTEEGLNALLDGPANANRQFGTLISQLKPVVA